MKTGKLRFAVMLAPLVLFVLLTFDLPVLTMLGWSFSNPTPTVRHYLYLFETPVYLKGIGKTLRIASLTTISCIILFLFGAEFTIPKLMFNRLEIQIDPTVTAVATLLILFTVASLGCVALLTRRSGLLLSRF
ncbi:hypothetical protein NKH28_32275 [Mesorhizobium sp. M1227]|uniref:hypothetical protein n=1 Tax=Mesorhizobium sp. M1227 TaxID=2957071 RepID=UPI003337C246